MNLKERFIYETVSKVNGKPVKAFDVLVTLVKLPTGAIEVITNSQHIDSKIEYLINAYNEDFQLNANPKVEIVGFTVY